MEHSNTNLKEAKNGNGPLESLPTLELVLTLVVCEVPEAGLSVNDKTTDSDEVYFNTKHDCTVYT